MSVAECVYHNVFLCKLSDASAPSRQLLSRFWVGSGQHSTPMVLMDLVSARQLPDISIAAHQFGIIFSAHITVTRAVDCEVPERLKALEALCQSHAAQQFGVQMLQSLMSSDQYSAIEIESCKMMMKYLTCVYEGVLMYHISLFSLFPSTPAPTLLVLLGLCSDHESAGVRWVRGDTRAVRQPHQLRGGCARGVTGAICCRQAGLRLGLVYRSHLSYILSI